MHERWINTLFCFPPAICRQTRLNAFAFDVQKLPLSRLFNTSMCTISAFFTVHPQLACNRLPKGGGVGGLKWLWWWGDTFGILKFD